MGGLRKGLQLCKIPFFIFIFGFTIRLLIDNSYIKTSRKLSNAITHVREIKFTHKNHTTSISLKDILKNNLHIVIVCLFSWVFLALPSVTIILVNSYLLADILLKTLLLEKPILLLLLLPHTVFEFIGFFIAAGISMNIVSYFIKHRKIGTLHIHNEMNTWLRFSLISILFILFAALVEYYVTFNLVSFI
jgi:uncharacterized membrane protein SpoIIM required for sporulation